MALKCQHNTVQFTVSKIFTTHVGQPIFFILKTCQWVVLDVPLWPWLICYSFFLTLMLCALLTLLFTNSGRVYKVIPSFCKKLVFIVTYTFCSRFSLLLTLAFGYFITFHNYFGPFWKIKRFHIIYNIRPSHHFIYLVFLGRIVSDLFGLTSLEYP